MRRQIPILFVSRVVLLFASSAIFAADTPHQNASGKWKLNLQKSDFGNTPAPKSADLTVAETGDKLTWSYSGTTAEGKSEQLTFDGLIGKSEQLTFDGLINGKEFPVQGEAQPTTVAYTRDDGTTHAIWKSGNQSWQSIITMSPDGKTLTVKNVGNAGPSGENVTWTEVWEKQQ